MSFPTGPALDPQDDIFFSDSNNNVVRGVSSLAAPVNLGSVAVGSASNPQDVTVTNNGNLPLTLTSLSVTANFNLDGPDTTCTGSSTLNPGNSCVLGIVFAPVTGGSLTGAINLVDNAGPQAVDLAGVGIPLSTTTTVISSLNPSTVGQSVTFTATVTPVEGDLQREARRLVQPRNNSEGGGGGPPAEMVSFYDGSTLLGTVTADSGVATLATSSLIGGAHNITAVFLGNAAYITSTSSILVQVVLKATATTLTAAPNPATAGQAVTLTATVTPTPTVSPLGTVNFYDGETRLGSGNVNSSGIATFSTTTLPAGANSLTAVYSGNASFAASTSSAVTETVNAVTSAATTTTLTASPNPAGSGQTVTFTATISPTPTGTPTGTVTFYSGSALLGTATVNSSGVATFTSSSLPTGALSLTAVYSGNAGFATSTSSTLAETVNTAYTVTAPSTPFTAAEGASVVIDVTVPPVGGAFNSVVTMSATGLPPGATASFNPPTVTPGTAGAPTVLTIQLATVAALIDPHRSLPFASFAFAIGLCSVGFRPKRLVRRFKRAIAVAVLCCAASTLFACGGGFVGAPTTQPGSYVVTITGTSGSAQVSTTVTVVVQ